MSIEREELKKQMIKAIGTHSNALVESIAEKCVNIVQHTFPLLGKTDVEPCFSDEEIAKAACRENHIGWDESVDRYDSAIIDIWCEGATWMQKALLPALKNSDLHLYQLKTADEFYKSVQENHSIGELMQMYAEHVAIKFAAECVNEALGNKMEVSNTLYHAIEKRYKSIKWNNHGN